MSNGVTIREMPESERPRERLAHRGANALTDAELIAVLLGSGTREKNAVELGAELLREHGQLSGLARASVADLQSVKGIGFAKACHLVAAFGLGSRLAMETIGRERLNTPADIYALLAPEMRHLRVESLRILLLNTKNQLIGTQEVSVGSVDQSVAHPREVLRPAVLASAKSFIVVHNHPSGDPEPSGADIRFTRRLADAAEIFQITFHDHVIIGAPTDGKPGYFSFKEGGLL